MAQTLMMIELDFHIGGNTLQVSHDKAKFHTMREHCLMIWLRINRLKDEHCFNLKPSFKIVLQLVIHCAIEKTNESKERGWGKKENGLMC